MQSKKGEKGKKKIKKIKKIIKKEELSGACGVVAEENSYITFVNNNCPGERRVLSIQCYLPYPLDSIIRTAEITVV